MKKIAIGLLIAMAFSNVTVLAEDKKIELEEKITVEEIENSNENGNEIKEDTKIIKEDSKAKKEKSSELYEFKEVISIESKNKINLVDENGIIKEEFTEDLNGLKEIKYLKNKTDKIYEVALAHDDGNYSFIEAFDNYDESIKFIEEAKEIEGNLTVIDENGLVIYAEESMGRVIKYINGAPLPNYSSITNVYTDSSLKTAHTYINHGYIDDVPIIVDKGNVAKIMVSGYSGWVNKDSSAKEYDLVVVPLNQVVNPSYYIVENGELNHFISSDIKTVGKGHKIKLGPAPNFLEQNKKYYSYDNKYFYKSLSELISDLKADSSNKAVNKSNPYYSYYLNLPFRSKTNHSAATINDYIEKNTQGTSKLRNTGQDFIDAEKKYGVNALLALGVAINESGWGMSAISQEKNNLFGLKATDANPGGDATAFNTVRDSIFNFAKGYISLGYSNSKDWRYYGSHLGNKKNGVNVKYASDPFWGEKANNHIYRADYNMSNMGIDGIKDNNYYQLGIYNKIVPVKNLANEKLYNAKVETPVIIIDKNNDYSLGGESVYRTFPDRPVLESENFNGEYLWNKNSYVSKTAIDLVNQGKYNLLFKDVPEGFWAKKQIEKFYDKGYLIGYEDGTFRPDNSITRAEFVKLINKYFNFYKRAEKENFDDVNSDDWYYNEVLIAINQGYIEANNKNFRPKDFITREEAAAIITTIKKKKDNNLDKLNEYIDKDEVSNWAKSSVEGAIENRYMGQSENKKFRPKSFITRAEAVATLDRIK